MNKAFKWLADRWLELDQNIKETNGKDGALFARIDLIRGAIASERPNKFVREYVGNPEFAEDISEEKTLIFKNIADWTIPSAQTMKVFYVICGDGEYPDVDSEWGYKAGKSGNIFQADAWRWFEEKTGTLMDVEGFRACDKAFEDATGLSLFEALAE